MRRLRLCAKDPRRGASTQDRLHHATELREQARESVDLEAGELAAEVEVHAAGPQAGVVARVVGEGDEQRFGEGLQAAGVADDAVTAGAGEQLDLGFAAAGDAEGELDAPAAATLAGAQVDGDVLELAAEREDAARGLLEADGRGRFAVGGRLS